MLPNTEKARNPASPAVQEKDNRRQTTINIRAHSNQISVIDQAAAAKGQTRSAFMLEHAVQAAEAVLIDRCLFVVDDNTFEAIQAVLDAPVQDNPALTRLLTRKAPWDPPS